MKNIHDKPINILCIYLKHLLYSGIFIPVKFIGWQVTDYCTNTYISLDAYIMTSLSDSLGIRFDCTIGAPIHGKYVVSGMNSIYKMYPELILNLG